MGRSRFLIPAVALVVMAASCSTSPGQSSDQSAATGLTSDIPVLGTEDDCVEGGDCSPAGDSVPSDRSPSTTEAPPPTSATAPLQDPADARRELFAGYPVGFTEEGYPYLGNPDATVSLIEFSDYQCPFCARHFQQTEPTLFERYGNGADVNFIYRDLPLVSLHAAAPAASAAALCVSEQGAALFWAMHHAIFDTQSQWAALPDPVPFLAGLAADIGADVDAYNLCMAAGRTRTIVDQSVAEAQQLGFSATPTFQLVNNETGEIYVLSGALPAETFITWLEAVVAGEGPPVEEQQAADQTDSSRLPFWATPEGLAPDPDRPGRTIAGDPFKGDPDAPLVVVEFGDFQCPACRAHALDTQPVLDTAFVDAGDVLWVFKNLPLSIHPQAPAAAAAAECAADQGSFWEMHHLLYETVDRWAVDPPDPQLIGLAEELGLDTGRFATCLGGRDSLEHVLDDLYDAQGIAESTPSFVIIYGGTGQLLRGSLPPDQFVAALDSVLEEARPAG